MLSTLLIVFATVFVAELVGDKTLYTLGSLTARYRLAPVFLGASAAFMLKMLAAVSLGRLLTRLPTAAIAVSSALVFFAMALTLLRSPADVPPEEAPQPHGRYVAGMSFAAIALSEWGDPGQLAAATFAAQGRSPLAVWTGASLAVMAKALLAALLGKSLRQRVSPRTVRIAGALVCATMGVLAAFQIEI